jgi:heme/copper-type cytochrome/quinol oxidase subunit 3
MPQSVFIQRHAFHLVDPSAKPILTSFAALTIVVGLTLHFHGYIAGFETALCGLVGVLFSMFFWWQDIVDEGSFEGSHTNIVQLGLRYGMILFILSEIMFFFAFFWAFFASSLTPTIEIGNIWPPKGINTFKVLEIPLANTLILLCSGVSITYAHHAITAGLKLEVIFALLLTVILAVVFTFFQAYEYINADFRISDGVYGSCFFMTTGFHGFHVLIGTIFITISLVRLILNHFTKNHHFGFEAAAFYWHFVDVVWLFLYAGMYFWGGA